ncbi:MAG: N-acylglucosamine 2-epimerase [Micavibrio sp.]|nr:N-acylglucosamine 2-epimerase [Micavibrio sp.]HCK33208.1 N-acylglucosamine 2-epimerase [Rhodospirillaceae bacterium]
MRSIVENLNRYLQKRWVPKWHHAFADPQHGGFYERIAEKFKPLDMGYKRLVTQCRQIAIYSHAGFNLKDLADRFEFLIQNYHVAGKGWRFSVTDEGKPYDKTRDLYAHAFVIFTLSLYYKATGDERAKDLAEETLNFIKKYFKTTIGYHEALDDDLKPLDKMRRQNPHMHLFEACLFAYETFDDQHYLLMADEIYRLFKDYFFIDGTLREFFDEHLNPDIEKGHIVEPGHHFEWVWLLQKYRLAKGLENDKETEDYMRQLLYWANEHGWDEKYGGIYNALDPDGNIIDEQKRIWPFAEGLKANAMMLDLEDDKISLKKRTDKMVSVFKNKYILKRGFWTEIVNRDLSPATDYLPGTTPYHLYFGIVETLGYLRGRGRSKSWTSALFGFFYSLRAGLSSAVKFLKTQFNQSR